MNAAEAKKEICGHPDCGRPSVITLRQELGEDKDPRFECYCRHHLNKALEFAQALWKAGSPPMDGKWTCSYNECSEKCVFSYRVMSDGKAETFNFCHLHLALAFESLGMLCDQEAA